MKFELDGKTYRIFFTRHKDENGKPWMTECAIKVLVEEPVDAPKVYELVCAGVATCSTRDCFNKELGRQIALGRALKEGQVEGVVTVELAGLALEAYANRFETSA